MTVNAAVAGLFVGSCAVAHLVLGDAAAIDDLGADTGAELEVDIEVPVPIGSSKVAAPESGGCHGGCSLAKHSVPELTVDGFKSALRGYAETAYWQESEALDTLLFYAGRTRELIAEHGSEPLSPEHLAFLRRELGREHAVVAIRMVDDSGRTRVQYGPERVPLGVKEHLQPAETGALHQMEFNGTVVRTGLYHLWSRY